MTSTPLDAVSSSAHPAPERGRVGLAALWFGLFGGAAAWSVQTLANTSVASHGCFPRMEPLSSPTTSVRGITFVVSVAALMTCVAATAVAVHSWRRTRGEQRSAAGRASEHTEGTATLETGEGRTRFMALAGVLASSLFLVASIIHTASLFLVSACAS